jgi:hypothetical protein
MNRKIEAMLGTPSPAAEKAVADRLARASEVDDRVTFDQMRREIILGRIAVHLARESGREPDFRKGEAVLAKGDSRRTPGERRAANAARQWFFAFLKKHGIASIRYDEGGGANNFTSNRTSDELTKELQAIVDERNLFERNRRFNSHTARTINKLLLLAREISKKANGQQKLKLRQFTDALTQARDALSL